VVAFYSRALSAPRSRASRGAVALALLAGSAGLALVGYRALVYDHHQAAAESAVQILIASTFVGAGLYGAWRRPASRVGILLVVAGIGLLFRRLQYSNDPFLFTVGFATGELSTAFIVHAVLGYPTGRVRRASERGFVALAYTLAIGLPVATLVFYDPTASCFYDCDGTAHARSLIAAFPNDGVATGLRTAFRVVALGVLGVVFMGLVTRKLVGAGSAGRRLLAPLLIAGLAAATRAVLEGALAFSDYDEPVRAALFWWQMVVLAAIPLALLIGLLRARLARAAVADVLPALESARPWEVGRLLAGALGDRTLEVAFWYPEEQSYVDPAGVSFTLPAADEERSVTYIEHDGPIAVLVHDPMLEHEPSLVADVAAAARLALENARLQAEVQAQLAAVKESRARIVAAADTERRRIERDLHDGAQQRLLAVALELTSADRRRGELDRDELHRVLRGAVSELRDAVAELRDLAHGLHPTILAEQGLGPALSKLADRSSVPVTVTLGLDGRLPAACEATMYYVVSEALANVEKHAGACRVTIDVAERAGRVVAEVRDDGPGGADKDGSGLRGLRDRVEANGGYLRVASPAGQGTRIVAEVPCGS